MSSWRMQGIAAFFVIASNVAYADPIALSYKVQVSSCESSNLGMIGGVAGPPVTCQSFPFSFPMTVTFDSTATRTDRFGVPMYEFGLPRHSDVPVETPDLPPGATSRGKTWLVDSDGDNRFALLSSEMFVEIVYPGNNPIGYGTNMTLSGSDQLLFRGAPLAMLLVLLGKADFRYQYSVADPEEQVTLRRLTYGGVAVLEDVTPAPVPEPASLLLFGTGATFVARAVRRRRRATGHCG